MKPINFVDIAKGGASIFKIPHPLLEDPVYTPTSDVLMTRPSDFLINTGPWGPLCYSFNDLCT